MSTSPSARLRAQRDDFAIVVREHSKAVYGAAARGAGVRFAADVTQEVFLRLWRNPAMFDPDRGTLRALLVTMARNLSVDALRAEGSRLSRHERSVRRAPPVEDAGPEATVVQRDNEQMVAVAVRHLPNETRAAVVMAFYGDMSYRRAALALRQPEGTVKSRIRAGLHQLRRELAAASPIA